MSTSQSIVARVSHTFSAPAERVYDAWLDPTRIGQWLFATPSGEMVRVQIDPRVGGCFNVIERRDGEDVEHIGEFVELVRPTRLVFLFQVPMYGPGRDRVTVDIREGGPTSWPALLASWASDHNDLLAYRRQIHLAEHRDAAPLHELDARVGFRPCPGDPDLTTGGDGGRRPCLATVPMCRRARHPATVVTTLWQ
jgi:uncharacterized protein YndB with AHSA1/START domain